MENLVHSKGGVFKKHSSMLVYSQSDDPVCACRFVGECGEWMRAGLREGTASKFRQGRPGLALHAPV